MEIDVMLQQAVGPLLVVFLFTSILSLSLGVTVKCLLSALQPKRLVTVSLVTNFVLVPLVGVAIATIMPLDAAAATGVIIYALLCGPESGPKFVQLAGGNALFALSLLVLFLVYTVCIGPFVLPLFVQGASFDVGAVVIKLAIIVGLPLFLGIFINSRSATVSRWLYDIAHRISVVTLFILLFVLIYLNYQTIAKMNINEMLAGLLFFVMAFAAGYIFGGPSVENRRALAIMSFARNGSISMLIAASVFGADSKELVIVTVMTVVSVILAVTVTGLFHMQHRVQSRQAL